LNRTITQAEPTAFLAATGAPSTGKIARLPFDHAWVKPGLDATVYGKVFLRPINLSHLNADAWEESMGIQLTSREAFLGNARDVARQWDRSLREAFQSPDSRLKVVDSPGGEGTLVLEIALTEIVFGRPETYVASMAVTGGGIAESAMLAPTTAFEASIRDGRTGELLATAADRRGTRIKVVDFNRLYIDKANSETCADWSLEIVRALNKQMFPVVKAKRFSVF
jgi:hypothetical protein